MKYLLLSIAVLLSDQVLANESFPAKARLFGGTTWAKNPTLNSEMTSLGLREFETYPKYGAEITFGWSVFEVGLNYTKRFAQRDEITGEFTTAYNATLTQDVVLLVGRYPITKSNNFRADVYVGVGAANTSLSVYSQTQSGELTRQGLSDFTVPYASGGASVGYGFKGIYLYIEAGYDYNKVDNFTRSGNLSNNIQSIDLSGAHGAIGVMFDVTAFKK